MSLTGSMPSVALIPGAFLVVIADCTFHRPAAQHEQYMSSSTTTCASMCGYDLLLSLHQKRNKVCRITTKQAQRLNVVPYMQQRAAQKAMVT